MVTVISDAQLAKLSERFGGDWPGFMMIELNMSSGIISKYKDDDSMSPRDRLFAIFREWKKREGIKATKDALLQHLQNYPINEEVWSFLSNNASPKPTQPSDKDNIISDKMLERLAKNIGQDWKAFALHRLKITANEIQHCISIGKSHSKQFVSALIIWKIREGSKATVLALVNKLEQHPIDKRKWDFLLEENCNHDEISDEELFSEDDIASFENLEDVIADTDVMLDGLRISLPPNSSFSQSHKDIAHDDEKITTNANNSENKSEKQFSKFDRDNLRKEQDDQKVKALNEMPSESGSTHEDIEVLAAVLTGLTKSKDGLFSSLASDMSHIIQKLLKLHHENHMFKMKVNACSCDSSTQTSTRYMEEVSRPTKVTPNVEEVMRVNKEWEKYCYTLIEQHKNALKERDREVKTLSREVREMKEESEQARNQLDSIISATTTQTTNIENAKSRAEEENERLHEHVAELTVELTKVKKLTKSLLEQQPTDTKQDPKPRQRRFSQGEEHENPEEVASTKLVKRVNIEKLEDELQIKELLRIKVRPPPSSKQHISVLNQRPVEKVPATMKEERESRALAREKVFEKASKNNDIASDMLKEQLTLLKTQLKQFERDFQQERLDREKTAGELDIVKDELRKYKTMYEKSKTEAIRKMTLDVPILRQHLHNRERKEHKMRSTSASELVCQHQRRLKNLKDNRPNRPKKNEHHRSFVYEDIYDYVHGF